MKRKGARDIPDFSSKRKPVGGSRTPAAPGETAKGSGKSTRAPAGRQNVKPQSTNAKSGHRGS